MDKFHIYLAGGMNGLSHEDKCSWRSEISKSIMKVIDVYGHDYMPVFFNPLAHYDYDFDFNDIQSHKSEREVFELDLYNLRKSDLIVVNFNSPSSIGTAMELAIAKEHRIPIVGLNEDGNDLHAWLTECCTRICDTMEELVDHVSLQYLLY